ncbi:hypothetical protein O9929_12215 [Vibrio lentus]|nr:hypothetical protein [Vibrio lentus]
MFTMVSSASIRNYRIPLKRLLMLLMPWALGRKVDPVRFGGTEAASPLSKERRDDHYGRREAFVSLSVQV